MRFLRWLVCRLVCFGIRCVMLYSLAHMAVTSIFRV